MEKESVRKRDVVGDFFKSLVEHPFKLLLTLIVVIIVYISVTSETIDDPLSIKGKENYIYTKRFHKIPYILTSHIFKSNDFDRITLCLHTSYKYLSGEIVKHVQNWEGPISLGVSFAQNVTTTSIESACAYYFFANLQLTMQEARSKLSVHFLFTNTFERYRDTDGVDEFVGRITELYKDFDYNQKCTKEEFSESEQARLFNNYPINVVRNMARFYSNSKYILSADMNHLFSRNFERKMINLANKVYTKGNNFALTYRIFEVNQNQTEMPNTKVLLKELMKKGLAFEFHHYMAAHKIKNLSEWLNTPESHLNTDPQFNVTLTNAQWEPQFVSLRNVPFHDESFFYPVRDNTVQRWEMCHLNYQFVIANDVFMFHHGIKERQEKNTIEMARLNIFPWAFQAMTIFTNKMALLYPKTHPTCPEIDRFFGPKGKKIKSMLGRMH